MLDNGDLVASPRSPTIVKCPTFGSFSFVSDGTDGMRGESSVCTENALLLSIPMFRPLPRF